MVSHMMAAESDGVVNLAEEQPIDLSKVNKKPMPPLIPISLLRPDYQSFCQERKKPPQRTFSHPENHERNRSRVEWRENKRDDDDDNDSGAAIRTRKRVRQESELEDRWAHCKLDRARSVPQLTPLSTLQRNKSLSESRITEATTNVPGNYKSDEHFQVGSGILNQRHPEYGGTMQPSWVYIGYYSQLLHRFQAQEMLRQFALHQEREIPLDEQNGGAETQTNASMTEDVTLADQSEEAAELRRRQSRPLTGKHVRPGTGASPSTLLSLRRKIQARRQQQDDPS